ncbi:tetrathionate reductase family octaheme c-type cytochrome [Puniceicoccales bacterium CK1056]|uniref:Tetrathionate reductase family octaheme c-type cytochrome n=1 Tax=Oceanipulchritudo coccoides TaxID=2706888 RepID=A0A6B2M740_9BACT|nr:tetrathionate reductase family octaheme c-type cytochrome [Oceanipulchritudo coccoides]NDV63450.1 tetrathionate reductase family octaheme c-type cytochrome [Oceanipulchritudo coccoides]
MKSTPQMLLRIASGLLLLAPLGLIAQHGSMNYVDATTCLNCHQNFHPNLQSDVMNSLHWTWEKTDSATGQVVGKKNVINNYCIAVASNEPRCTSCHIGVGYADNTFDFDDPSKIDCLVCHDQTGTYKKVPTGAGAPDPGVDLTAVARSVDLPDRNNCGICHFYGGGGEGVKHGSMDSSLLNPSRELDVHMSADGGNMVCSDCHAPDEDNPHDIVGSRYSQAAPDNMMCKNCHEAEGPVHANGFLNTHADTVACQTCHIPAYARGGKATKMYWDWTTAGQKNPDGSQIVTRDADGNVIYDTKKGSFIWKENVIPETKWFNGTVTYTLLDDQLPAGRVTINKLGGDINDDNAYIFPVKRFVGRQPYDAGANTFAVPNLFPNNAEDTTAYWKAFDWDAALTSGMDYVGRTFVGPVGIVDTEMFWIQNHMVAPKEMALTCTDCHTWGSRINFYELGFENAQALQTSMQSDPWVNTGDWMGWINVDADPWIWVMDIGKYIYMPGGAISSDGGWAYAPK